MQKNTALSLIISTALVGGTFYFMSDRPAPLGGEVTPVQNIEIRDGVQYVTIVARGGYAPRVTEATGGLPTQLVVKTENTYDCSVSLVIRSVGFQKILSPTGEEVIDLGTPAAGATIQGVCGMGMYSFKINFR